MAVDQVSAISLRSPSSAGEQDSAGLREGTQLEGRVMALNPDGSLKLATRYGILDVDQWQIASASGAPGRGNLPPASELIGTTVRIEVAGQSPATGRFQVRLIAPGETSSTSNPEPAPNASAMATAARLSAEIGQAAARQDGLAPVFADADLLTIQSGQVPDEVAEALDTLAGLAVDKGTDLTADDIRNAVASSGLFLEARLARLASGTAAEDGGFSLSPDIPLANQDLKAALFGLKAALDHWISDAQTELFSSSETTQTEQQARQQTQAASAGVAASDGRADQTAEPDVDTEALFAVLRPPPVVATSPAPQTGTSTVPFADGDPATSAALSDGLGGAGSDVMTLAELGEWYQASGQLPQTGGRRGAYGGRPMTLSAMRRAQSQPGEISAKTRPPPPRRGSLPQGQAAIRLPATSERQTIDLARDLTVKVGNALARLSLGQFASLPDRFTGQPNRSAPSENGQGETSWLFEMPLRIGNATSIAQFEIDQVMERDSGKAINGRAWRVQFGLDVAPLGPVYGRLMLAERRLSVGLWAEERTCARGFQFGLATLRTLLEQADFVIDDIHVAHGRPPSGPPVRAGGFFDRNA